MAKKKTKETDEAFPKRMVLYLTEEQETEIKTAALKAGAGRPGAWARERLLEVARSVLKGAAVLLVLLVSGLVNSSCSSSAPPLPGTYTVTMTPVGNDGCSPTMQQLTLTLNVDLTGALTGPSGPPLSLSWDQVGYALSAAHLAATEMLQLDGTVLPDGRLTGAGYERLPGNEGCSLVAWTWVGEQ